MSHITCICPQNGKSDRVRRHQSARRALARHLTAWAIDVADNSVLAVSVDSIVIPDNPEVIVSNLSRGDVVANRRNDPQRRETSVGVWEEPRS